MYGSSRVVPINIHAEVSLSVPVMGALIVFIEDRGKMSGVFAADVLYPKVVHSECE